jgi:sugar phosphate isomerase/epimerase
VVEWEAVLRGLADAGYRGGISLELEDEDYLGSFPAEKEGYSLAAKTLTTSR